jgi:hypothetical protein
MYVFLIPLVLRSEYRENAEVSQATKSEESGACIRKRK